MAIYTKTPVIIQINKTDIKAPSTSKKGKDNKSLQEGINQIKYGDSWKRFFNHLTWDVLLFQIFSNKNNSLV